MGDQNLSLTDALGELDQDDLQAWDTSGRFPLQFEDLLHAATRAQFMLAAIGPAFGPEVEAGLAREGVTMALALAAHPADDASQRDAKRQALREYVPADAEGVAGVMVRAALAYDDRRLAPTRAVRPDSKTTRADPDRRTVSRTRPHGLEARTMHV